MTNRSQTFTVRDYLRILLSLVFVGLAIATILYKFTPTVYESNAQFRISKSSVESKYEGLDFSSIIDVRHDQLLPQANFVLSSVYDNKLELLSTFADQRKIVSLAQENLIVTQNTVEPSIYKIAFRCNDPDEGRFVVHSILSSYRDELVKLAKEIQRSHRDYVEGNYEAAIEEYEDAEINSDEKSLERALQRKNYFEDQRDVFLRFEPRQSFSFRILDSAHVGEPVWPRLPLFLIYGAAGGGMVGMSLILLVFFLSKLTY